MFFLLLLLLGCAARVPLPSGKAQDVTFTRTSRLSSNAEIARRALTPLTFARGEQALAASGKSMREQAVDPAQEKFSLYVPGGDPPPGGWGLLVYIAPWEEATRPQLWRPALDKHRLVFVSAENSGNDAKVLDRRLPLALIAYENVRARAPIDPKRVFVGGLSGGSRAAEITALAYPDVFRGALLNAGSEPIGGEAGVYLPPADLFRLFQQTRLVYVTGEEDELNLHDDLVSRASMRAHCVFDIEVQTPRRLSHAALDPIAMERALDALDRHAPVDAGEAAKCNARLELELKAKLTAARAAVASGDRDEARTLLHIVDGRFAGLSAPDIVELDAKLSVR